MEDGGGQSTQITRFVSLGTWLERPSSAEITRRAVRQYAVYQAVLLHQRSPGAAPEELTHQAPPSRCIKGDQLLSTKLGPKCWTRKFRVAPRGDAERDTKTDTKFWTRKFRGMSARKPRFFRVVNLGTVFVSCSGAWSQHASCGCRRHAPRPPRHTAYLREALRHATYLREAPAA